MQCVLRVLFNGDHIADVVQRPLPRAAGARGQPHGAAARHGRRTPEQSEDAVREERGALRPQHAHGAGTVQYNMVQCSRAQYRI